MKNLYALSFALTLAFLSPAMADFVSKNKVANEVCDEYKKNGFVKNICGLGLGLQAFQVYDIT
ncbi:MAG: hypothetical protein JNL11_19530 [Bdellovibrionaceae bacterium]|nr:hypothetical protein [Pseudobdellovibrionaceae bacterium]